MILKDVRSRVRISKGGILAVGVTSLVVINEWLSYALTAASWPVVPSDPGNSVRVLIAADPQILSTQSKSEPSFPFNIVTIWDADRYVSRGFHLALWRTKPDVVVFLGDLLNDGSISSDSEFNSSLHHFRHLMHIPSYVKNTIFVPGDNDIGGEGIDQVTHHKVHRFFSFFNQTATLQYKFIDFIQIRVMDDFSIGSETVPKQDGRLRILLSHMPLLPRTKTKLKEKIREHHPTFIFSGHEHDSFHFAGSKAEGYAQEFQVLKDEQKVWEFEGSGSRLHEVTVPTCSYRMGRYATGYGLAVIDVSGRVQYTVLWLPSRFTQLWLYVMALAMLSLIIIFSFIHSIKNCLLCLIRTCAFALFKAFPKYHKV